MTGDPPPPDLTVDARAPLAVWRRGSGEEAVLLVHGYPDHGASMLALAQHLAGRGLLALAVALPGFAPSAPVEASSADDVCGDLLRVLDAVGVRRAHVVGHDWGAAFAYHLGCHHAERVDRLVALAVPHPQGFAARRATPMQARTLTYALELADPARGPAAAADRAWVTSLASTWSPGLHREDWPLVLDTVCSPQGAAQTHRLYRDDLAGRARPTGVVRRPATVIHGAQDGCITPAVFCGLEHLFEQGLTTHLLPAAGHWPHLEQPDVVHPLVAAALAG